VGGHGLRWIFSRRAGGCDGVRDGGLG
jgi:hypothetical protein